ncbi:hypothetical protein BDV98DRAFT_593761 [Pterulicium gracile]|uniref:Uncharacterized protein n=1 Tax=Pterulicium gracile TaxID=1884261 RepID=A0A5C3QL58_9AGAR|nr:hypothetical protein BDV98DRAFT_593761 [Pterula gracilis]
MPTEGFALASIKGNVHLVHVHTTHTPLLELRIFRHEFITIFRFSHSALVDPAEVRILESIGDKYAMYEEESDTVVLAKDLTERLLSRRAGSSPSSKRYSYGHGRQMYAPMGMQRAYAYR